MKKLVIAVLTAALLIPAPGASQGVGVGAKLGTLGYGVDAGLSLGSRFVLRGGVAFSPQRLFITDIIPADIVPGDIVAGDIVPGDKGDGEKWFVRRSRPLAPRMPTPATESPATMSRSQ